MVNELVHLLRSEEEGSHHLAGVDLLAASVDDALLYQAENAVGEHLGMKTEILMVGKSDSKSIRKSSDAHLKAGSVRNQLGAILSYELLHLVRLGEILGHQWSIVINNVIDKVRCHQVAVGERHILIDNGNHRSGTFDGSQRAVHGSSQREIAILVRTGNLDHRHIAPQGAAPVKFLGLAQMHREIVGIAGIDIGPDIRPQEEALVEEDSLVGRVGIGCRSLSMEMMEMEIPHLSGISPAAQCLDQHVRNAGHTAEMNVVPCTDSHYCFVGCDCSWLFHKSWRLVLFSIIWLFMEKIPDRQGGGIPLPEPLEEGSGIVGEARPLPGTGVRDHYPAFSVRIIFDQG